MLAIDSKLSMAPARFQNGSYKVYFYNKGMVKKLKYLSGTVSSSSNARH